MTQPERIVVGVDGSEEALGAVRWAAGQAKETDGQLTIVCVYSLASYSAAALDGGFAVIDDEYLREGATEAVNEAAKVAEEYGVIPETVVTLGDPTAVLVELSEDSDLVVIASRGGGGFADRLLGAVSSAVPAHSKCPTVVVPIHESGRPFIPIERIVVGVDGSDVAATALARAIDVAIAWDAELTVVVAVPIGTGGGAMSWIPGVADRKAMMEDTSQGLDMAIEQALAGRELEIARHTLDGSPGALLTEFSTAVDLVVVGTRGRGGFAGMLLGSTSQTLLGHSTCPVMTVPARHRDRRPHPTRSWERR